jgi:hypothetical protein
MIALTNIEPILLNLSSIILGVVTSILLLKRFILQYYISNTKEISEKSQASVISILTDQIKHQTDINSELTEQVHKLLKAVVISTNETIEVKNQMITIKEELSTVLKRLNVYERRTIDRDTNIPIT